MKKLLGLLTVTTLGLFAYIPREAPAAQVEHATSQEVDHAATTSSMNDSDLTAKLDTALGCTGNCCEFSEDGTRCILCRKVCP